jgi:hypothetical protein
VLHPVPFEGSGKQRGILSAEFDVQPNRGQNSKSFDADPPARYAASYIRFSKSASSIDNETLNSFRASVMHILFLVADRVVNRSPRPARGLKRMSFLIWVIMDCISEVSTTVYCPEQLLYDIVLLETSNILSYSGCLETCGQA